MSIRGAIINRIEEALRSYVWESEIENAVDQIDINEMVSEQISEMISAGDIDFTDVIEDYISRELNSIRFEDMITEAIENAVEEM